MEAAYSRSKARRLAQADSLVGRRRAMTESHPLDFLVSALADVTESEEAIGTIVSVAVEAVGTSFGGITLIHDHGKRFETVGSTDPSVIAADHLQYELGEGPCVAASLEGRSFHSSDLATDPQWPAWGPRVSELGFRSVLSTQIHGRGQRIGALNLYGSAEKVFDDNDVRMAGTFAQQAALILGFVLHEAELLEAMESHSIVGQAQGILMQRFQISSATAFALLRRYSMDTNTRVRDLAEYVITTHDLPPTPG
jgi:GAF domain-containing protein